MAKSTIYRHWPDKLALIADAFETFHEQMVPDLGLRSARESIELLLRHVAEVVVDSTFSRCIPALIEGAERDARVREFHHRYSADRRQGADRPDRRGRRDGDFRHDVDPELATPALLGAIFYRRLMTGEPFEPNRAAELVATVLPAPELRAVPRWSVPSAMQGVRAAIVIPSLFAFCDQVIGNLQMATFAAFGGFATLVLAGFREPAATS